MYRKTCVTAVLAAIADGTRKVTDALAALKIDSVSPHDWKPFDESGHLFKNMNTPEDFEEADAILGRRTRRRSLKMADHYFEFKDVSKSFGDLEVLKDVSFFVNQGETGVILGRSGVGKSVSLKLLLGFLYPDSGRIIVAGEDVTGWTEAKFAGLRRRVTMVFQSGALFDSLTVAENVAFPLEGKGLSQEQIDARVNELLDMLEVREFADQLPGEPKHRHKTRGSHRTRPRRRTGSNSLRRADHHG